MRAAGQPVHSPPAAELFSGFIQDDPAAVFLPSSVQYHAAVQGETVDPDWGPSAAARLREYIALQYANRFEVPLADCRRDLCELQVAGRLGANVDADMREVEMMMQVLRRAPLWSALQLDQETTIIGMSPDGRALLLAFISRR